MGLGKRLFGGSSSGGKNSGGKTSAKNQEVGDEDKVNVENRAEKVEKSEKEVRNVEKRTETAGPGFNKEVTIEKDEKANVQRGGDNKNAEIADKIEKVQNPNEILSEKSQAISSKTKSTQKSQKPKDATAKTWQTKSHDELKSKKNDKNSKAESIKGVDAEPSSKIPRWSFFGRKKQDAVATKKALKESENQKVKVRCMLKMEEEEKEHPGKLEERAQITEKKPEEVSSNLPKSTSFQPPSERLDLLVFRDKSSSSKIPGSMRHSLFLDKDVPNISTGLRMSRTSSSLQHHQLRLQRHQQHRQQQLQQQQQQQRSPFVRPGSKAGGNTSDIVNLGIVARQRMRFEEKIAANEQMKRDSSRVPKANTSTSKTPSSVMTNSASSSSSADSAVATTSSSSSLVRGQQQQQQQQQAKKRAPTSSTFRDSDGVITEEDEEIEADPPNKSKENAHQRQSSKEDFLIDDEYLDQPELTTSEMISGGGVRCDSGAGEDLSSCDIFGEAAKYGGGRQVFSSQRTEFFRGMEPNYDEDYCPYYVDEEYWLRSRPDLLSRLRRFQTVDEESTMNHHHNNSSSNSSQRSGTNHSNNKSGFSLWGRRQKSVGSPTSLSTAESLHLSQEIMAIKIYLLKLKRILQENEPLPEISSQLQSFVDEDKEDVVDLRRQIELLQQQNEEKDRLIRGLRRRLGEQQGNHPKRPNSSAGASTNSSSSTSPLHNSSSRALTNAATQTERSPRAWSLGLANSPTTPTNSATNSGSETTQRNSLKRRLRRSRTPLSRVIHSSEDGTLTIPIKSTLV